MDRGTWWATLHRVTKNQTRLKLLNTHIHTHMTQNGRSFARTSENTKGRASKWQGDLERHSLFCCLVCQSFLTLCNPRTVAYQVPLSMGFPRQQYWSGLTFPSPGIFLTQGSNPHLLCLLHYRWILYLLNHWGSPKYSDYFLWIKSLWEAECFLINNNKEIESQKLSSYIIGNCLVYPASDSPDELLILAHVFCLCYRYRLSI